MLINENKLINKTPLRFKSQLSVVNGIRTRHKLFIVYYRNIYINTRGGVYTSQLISYSRTCVQYTDSLDRAQLRTQKLHKQDYVEVIATNTLRSL
jgi:hypothetical protein